MNIFITGGSGFIGNAFRKEAIKKNKITLFLREGSTIPPDNNFTELVIKKNMSQIKMEDLKSIDLIVHLAASGVKNPESISIKNAYKNNVIDPINFFEVAINKCAIKNFLVCGSCFEYGKTGEKNNNSLSVLDTLLPTNFYGSSKASFTMACISMAYKYSLNLSLVRPFHIYGEGESERRFFPSIMHAIKKDLDFDMSLGEQIRDFTYVLDLAKILIQECNNLISKRNNPKLLIKNIGSGNKKTLKHFATELWSKYSAKGRINFGKLPYRENEVMQYIPNIDIIFSDNT